jgi:receptor-type tyrosine-protein phosphatase F
VIVEAPVDQRVRSGGIAAFTCVAQGDPTPHITWRRNGNKIAYSQSRYLINDFPGGSVLRIEPARKKREDTDFECVAENGVGDPVSAKAKLDVLDGEIHSLRLAFSISS